MPLVDSAMDGPAVYNTCCTREGFLIMAPTCRFFRTSPCTTVLVPREALTWGEEFLLAKLARSADDLDPVPGRRQHPFASRSCSTRLGLSDHRMVCAGPRRLA